MMGPDDRRQPFALQLFQRVYNSWRLEWDCAFVHLLRRKKIARFTLLIFQALLLDLLYTLAMARR